MQKKNKKEKQKQKKNRGKMFSTVAGMTTLISDSKLCNFVTS